MYRLIAAGLSVVLIGTFFSLVSFVPSSQQEDNVYYFGFFETFIIVSIYSAPVYFLLGIPSSVVIDKIIHKGKRFDEYLFGLILYSLAGGIACIVTLFILGQNINFIGIIGASLLGCIAASLYYHLYIVVKKCGKKKRNKSSEKEAK